MNLRSHLAALAHCEVLPDTTPVAFSLPGVNGSIPAVVDLYNARVKLYSLKHADYLTTGMRALLFSTDVASDLISKIIIYTWPGEIEAWSAEGFRFEGLISGFFADGCDAWLWAGYPNPVRAYDARDSQCDSNLAIARGKTRVSAVLPDGYTSRLAEPDDAPALSELMQLVFPEYPTPLDAAFLRHAIVAETLFFRLVHDSHGNLAASASGELDRVHDVAEMTDCATRPDHRGCGLMGFLLDRLAADIRARYGIRQFYTLARAVETGMNCVFAKLGYEYNGRLINNCRMPDGWESMNVWCRTAD